MRIPSAPIRSLMRIAAYGLLVLAATPAPAAAPLNPANDAGESVVELPPFMVTSDPLKAHPWRYAAGPGCEILARCSDWIARDFFQRYQRLAELLRVVLPDEFQRTTDVPDTIVLVDQNRVSGLGRDIFARYEADTISAPEEGATRSQGTRRVRFLPNMALNDADQIVVLALVDEAGFTADTLTFHVDRVKSRLERRVPPLPAWFIDGFLALYGELWFRDDAVDIGPLTWIDEATTAALRRDPDYPRTFLPLSDLFEDRRPADTPENAPTLRIWRSEAALFIRWSLDEKEAARRTAFWQLVARASLGPVTESDVRERLGLGYADLRDRLSDYLPAAVNTAFPLRPESLAPQRAPRLRDATPAEVARIKGDCERLEVAYVRARHPRYVPLYLDQARRTLQDAYRRGIRDPQTLAALGLLECDAGRDSDAQPYLIQAASAQVRRPRVYLELARMHWADALSHADSPDGRPDAPQVKQVLAWLAAAHALRPPLVTTYVLTADVWARSGAVLDAQNFALLDEGLQWFPREPALIYFAAVLRAAHGFTVDAATLTERGLALSTGTGWEAKFKRLQGALTAAAAKDADPSKEPLKTSAAATSATLPAARAGQPSE